ncbi:hypothetical protein D9619_011993 [Psilocybe cf. subviscida]|uniref:Nephrocystin 3-like N-terminal domain-containing protein n=1 Tax=Psilocybe cf. subviscida TaxID=2480587 RepID=A0A8H5B0J1_9AGAR|nr:hypothetical protein D9619_011993 [Psilocybe cf. subviscida]
MSTHPTQSHMFESASKIVIAGGSFIGTQNNTGTADDKADPNTALVYNNVSWNAILNSGGRADAVRCYPGTREAVMEQIETWISPQDPTGQPIFWLSGPAGAGKSAIAQSIAERCLARGIPIANFFFFRADSTRNHATPLVATLLCQIFDICPAIKWRIHDFISQNFHIFDRSIEQQLKALMFSALIYPGQAWARRQKIVLILDGLDECSSDLTQQEILRSLHYIVTQKDSPFIALISSRAEPHLMRSFNTIHAQVARLYLDANNFSSSDDIRRFVTGEFKEIKETHHLARTLDADWPSTADIESIVRKSSGHFIYATTVMRFIQTSPESPVLSLEKVEGVRPVENDSPFAQLDAIYTHILAKARNWPRTREILAAQVLPDIEDASRLPGTSYMLNVLGYYPNELSSYTSDLTSLIKVESGAVEFYHTSLGDFLLDKRRSGEFFIDLDKFRLKLVAELFYCVGGIMDDVSWSLVVEHFTKLKTTSDAVTQALLSSSFLQSGLAFNGATLCAFLVKIHELYFDTNAALYRVILEKWLAWFHKNHGTLKEDQLDKIQHAGELWNQLTQTLFIISETAADCDTKGQEVIPSDVSSLTLEAESLISEMPTHLSWQSGMDPRTKEGKATATEQMYEGVTQGTSLSLLERNHGPEAVDSIDTVENRADSDDADHELTQVLQQILRSPEAHQPGEVQQAEQPWQDGRMFRQEEMDREEEHLRQMEEEIRRRREEIRRREQEMRRREERRRQEEERRQEQERLWEEESRQEKELQREHLRRQAVELRLEHERRQEEEHRQKEVPKVRKQLEAIQPRDRVPPPLPPLQELFSLLPQPVSPVVQAEAGALTQCQALQDLFTRSIGYAEAHELFAIRAEADAAATEVAGVRAAIVTARMDLEVAQAEARSVRADIKREAVVARNDVLEARAEVYSACAERDAARADMLAIQEEAKILRAEVCSARADLDTIRDETSKWKEGTSWWSDSLSDWNFF